MNREIHLAKKQFYTGLIGLPFFLFAMIGSMIVFAMSGPPEMRAVAVTLAGLFWGSWCLLCVWLLLACWLGRLRVSDCQIVVQGIWLRKEFSLAEVEEARWIAYGGGIRLRAARKRLRLHFENYEREDRLWLIRYFREQLPREVEQGDWELFCHKVAVPMRDDRQRTVPRADEVLVKRSRYDWLFAIGLVICTPIALFIAWQMANPAALGFLAILVLLWIVVHFATPKRGWIERRAPKQLIWLYSLLPLLGGSVILVKLFDLPEFVMIVPTVIIFLVAMFSMHRYERETKQRERRESAASAAVWEQGEL